jgi:hypothetical protein
VLKSSLLAFISNRKIEGYIVGFFAALSEIREVTVEAALASSSEAIEAI